MHLLHLDRGCFFELLTWRLRCPAMGWGSEESRALSLVCSFCLRPPRSGGRQYWYTNVAKVVCLYSGAAWAPQCLLWCAPHGLLCWVLLCPFGA